MHGSSSSSGRRTASSRPTSTRSTSATARTGSNRRPACTFGTARRASPRGVCAARRHPADPTLYDPAANPQQAKARRRVVLRAMLDQGDITQGGALARRPRPLPMSDIRLPDIQAGGAVLRTREGSSSTGTACVIFGGAARPNVHRPRPAAARRGRRSRSGCPPARTHPRHSSRSIRATAVCSRCTEGATAPRASSTSPSRGRQPGSAFKPFALATALEQGIPDDVLRVRAGDHLPRRPAVEGRELRGLESRDDRPRDGDDVLRQHRLRAADRARAATGGRTDGAAARDSEPYQGLLLAHARRGGQPARDGERTHRCE